MIFQHTLEQVLSGRKTQTRRLMRAHDTAERGPDGTILAALSSGRAKWRVGQRYSVQPGRTKAGVAHIRINGIRIEKLGQITDAGARKESFADRQDFLATWERIHGSADEDTPVWVIDFELVPSPGSDGDQAGKATRGR